MLQELEVFPQMTYSQAQGQIGTRKWTLDHGDNVDAFLDVVCRSHWPGYRDSIPMQVQYGSFFEGVGVRRDDGVVPHARTYETLGDLPQYGKMLIIAQYALHRMTNCWPDQIPKLWHPAGTTLSLKIRGSGQFILVTAAGVKLGLIGGPSTLCVESPASVKASMSLATRVIVPVAEYHISCDRMTRVQVNGAMGGGGAALLGAKNWDNLLGCVNAKVHCDPNTANEDFLGAPVGTLLFDGYEITETFACDVQAPCRYCMTAVFKKRIINNPAGNTLLDAHNDPVGWNHDYLTTTNSKHWAWQAILMERQLADETFRCLPRYVPVDFSALFGNCLPQDCGEMDLTTTPLGDCDFCEMEEYYEADPPEDPPAPPVFPEDDEPPY